MATVQQVNKGVARTFALKQAKELAERLAVDDETATYTVMPLPHGTNLAIIQVHDLDGKVLGYL